ncbi:hypothetical protein LPUS_06774 [Lasallia pustulata]|uniref:Uncharacterized protein n=1 Tax=Lasallia pustulata TaxID=136370 RepID=A0A1W5D1P4_9LECA|nr:hypothetical protein LPUS_06774 [Lasallia pustulata]
MNDFRTLQHQISQYQIVPEPEDYYELGYEVLRQCSAEAQAVLSAHYPGGSLQVPSSNGEKEKQQLQGVMLDASARRLQAQKIYLRAVAVVRWANSRNAILQGQMPHSGNAVMLQQADNNLRAELSTITDQHCVNVLRTKDAQAGFWLQEDPPLPTILDWIQSQH